MNTGYGKPGKILGNIIAKYVDVVDLDALPEPEKYLAEKKNALQRENKKQHGRISIREKLAEKRAVVMTQSKEKLKTHEQTKSTKNAER